MLKKVLFFSVIFYLGSLQFQAQSISGKVLDKKTESPIPFAKIYCLETQNGVISDSIGYWELDNIINNQMTLKISASDYDGEIIKVNNGNKDIIIHLNPAHIFDDSIL